MRQSAEKRPKNPRASPEETSGNPNARANSPIAARRGKRNPDFKMALDNHALSLFWFR